MSSTPLPAPPAGPLPANWRPPRSDTDPAHPASPAGAATAAAAARPPASAPSLPSAPALSKGPPLPRWTTPQLFGTSQEVLIEHQQAVYRLRITSLGKLILTK